MKKLLLGLGAATSVIAPIAAVVACGDTGSKLSKGEESALKEFNAVIKKGTFTGDLKDMYSKGIFKTKISNTKKITLTNNTVVEVEKAIEGLVVKIPSGGVPFKIGDILIGIYKKGNDYYKALQGHGGTEINKISDQTILAEVKNIFVFMSLK